MGPPVLMLFQTIASKKALSIGPLASSGAVINQPSRTTSTTTMPKHLLILPFFALASPIGLSIGLSEEFPSVGQQFVSLVTTHTRDAAAADATAASRTPHLARRFPLTHRHAYPFFPLQLTHYPPILAHFPLAHSFSLFPHQIFRPWSLAGQLNNRTPYPPTATVSLPPTPSPPQRPAPIVFSGC
ncbi:hypothetical protein CSUB01_00166 [Colletotrichum sublineola]|uniref:Uncharacterized protein n=1 Tax=Colletotrichum sublineola TaxID=1173701 RepID=A0A066X2A4_COLSU|nr:hypothetical protein CSUB01_00166 [Colletotrichum sublineola]